MFEQSFTGTGQTDRKSTRLNSSHSQISYAVFCLKKKQEPRDVRDGRWHLCVHAVSAYGGGWRGGLQEDSAVDPEGRCRVYGVRRNFFFFNDPAPTEIYTLPLPGALPF